MLARNMLLTPRHSSGPPVFDSVSGTGTHGLSSASTAIPFSHTAVAPATIYLHIVFDRTVTLSPVTCDGNDMALVDTEPMTAGAGGNAFLARYKYAVAAGAHTLSFTPNAAAWYAAGSVAYAGVGSEGTSQKVNGSGTSASQSATCAAGHLVLQAFGTNASTASYTTTASGGTNRFLIGSSAEVSLSISEATANTTFTATDTGVTNPTWCGLANELIP